MHVDTGGTRNPLAALLLAVAMLISLSAFRHTDVEGYTDPAFREFKFETAVLQMPDASIEFRREVASRLAKAFKKQGVRLVMHEDLFLPTREWDEVSSAQVYDEHGIDAGIVITIGHAAGDSTPVMTMFNATTTGAVTTGYAGPVTVVRDHASFEIALIDTGSRRTVWVGNLDTRGAGLLFVGTKDTAESLVAGLVREWRARGHLPR